jgi:hypothetical protein
MSSIRIVKAGDHVNIPAATDRAYRTGRREGERIATARAAAASALFRREVATLLDGLGTTLIEKNDAAIELWYSLASRVIAGGPLTE